MLSPVTTVIPLQLLAYHIAAQRGLDVDQPFLKRTIPGL
jgi:glucosamine--fructose-6-phosphate aminotransferase (isomerizing)